MALEINFFKIVFPSFNCTDFVHSNIKILIYSFILWSYSMVITFVLDFIYLSIYPSIHLSIRLSVYILLISKYQRNMVYHLIPSLYHGTVLFLRDLFIYMPRVDFNFIMV